MIEHTMIVSFDQPIPDTELDRYLSDIEQVMLDTGLAQTFAARRHVPVLGEEAVAAPVATAIVRIALPGTEALTKAFSAPGLHEVIEYWRSRHPYKVVWANHEPLT
ncbi:hypothetical protein ACFFV7_29805 [Nonomuraea spiralis]|uniref:Uncharacterized protein n=1 Tax=Nonomuraea spiralis TaxID=46182 RepID=A0ABV5ILL1_9ACTN|nr:hypothetical protein [Nonomuraea spiralis]